MSGRWVPPRYGSLRIHASPGPLFSAKDRGHRVRHRTEVDRDVLGLHHQLALSVEEGGRAVVALLDIGRVSGADQRRPHLLAGGAQGRRPSPAGRSGRSRSLLVRSLAASDLSSVTSSTPASTSSGAAARGSPPAARIPPAPGSRVRLAARRCRTSASSHSPRSGQGGCGSVKPSGCGGSGRGRGPAHDDRQADVDENDLAFGVAVPVALLVGGAEALAKVGLGRERGGLDRQLEGLAGVAHLIDHVRAQRRVAVESGDQLVDLGG